jgi:ABC-type multidrug transport system fused ATPase/permease subunit|eukprot:COSAG01_NODE_4752_length_4767_cov_1.979006_4_plen_252_part_00
MMPRVITDVLVDGRVSMRRLSVFLAEPTMTNAYVRPMPAAGREQNLVLEIRGGSFSWQPLPKQLAWTAAAGGDAARGRGGRGGAGGGRGGRGGGGKAHDEGEREGELEARRLLQQARESQGRAVLRGITLRVGRGQLCCVVGAVGSGKSSLVHAVLGEMAMVQPPQSEHHSAGGGGGAAAVYLGAKLAYAPQSAFTLNAAVRSNILFGLPYVQRDYDEVCLRGLYTIRRCVVAAASSSEYCCAGVTPQSVW